MAKATRVLSTPRRTASKIHKRQQEVKRPASAEDPVFELIETHRKLNREWLDLSSELSEAEIAAKKKHGDRPSEFVPWRIYNVSAANLEVTRAEVLKQSGVDPTAIQTEYWNLKARLLGAKPGAEEWDKNAGLARLRRDLDRALFAERRASWKLAGTKPTTAAGAGALLDYVKTMMFEIGDLNWHKHALDTIIGALAAMAPPTPSLSAIGRKAA
jgi:hypothetical protein